MANNENLELYKPAIVQLTDLLTITGTYVDQYYNVFLNPEPMNNIEIKAYGSDGEIQTVLIPNLAYLRQNCIIGEGSPEGVIEAPLGTFYLDTSASDNCLYSKQGNELEVSKTGWIQLLSTLPIDYDTIIYNENNKISVNKDIFEEKAHKGQANGYCPLNENTRVPMEYLPELGANKDLSNLSALGNTRLQYAPFSINSGTVKNGENATLVAPGVGTTWLSWQNPSMTSTSQDGYTVTYSNNWRTWGSEALYGWFADYNGSTFAFYNRNAGLPQWQQLACPQDKTLRMTGFYMPRAYFGQPYQTYSFIIKLYLDGAVVYNQTHNLTSYGQFIPINNVEFDTIYVGSSGGGGENGDWGGSYPLKFVGEELVSVSTADTIYCNPCICTTADGRVKEFNELSSVSIEDVSGTIIADTTWIQPTLNANGTLGGSYCACTARGTSSYNYQPAYYAFNNNTSNGWVGNTDRNDDLIFYTPVPIKISKINFINRVWLTSENGTTSFVVYGSNDANTYTQLATWSGWISSDYQSVNVSTNDYYKYFKITSTSRPSERRNAFAEIKFEATYQQIISGGNYAILKDYNTGSLSLNKLEISKAFPINVNTVGTLDNNNGIISGFSSTSWANLPSAFSPSTNNWTIRLKFKTSTFPTTETNVLLDSSEAVYEPINVSILASGIIKVIGYSNNSSTEIFRITGSTTLSDNTDYYVELSYDSTSGYALKLSTDGETFTTEGTSATTTPITGGYKLTLGADFTTGLVYNFGAFQGSIDLKECYININDDRFWSGVTFDYWLSISQAPLTLYYYNGSTVNVHNDKIYIGDCLIEGSVIESLTNVKFNNGWFWGYISTAITQIVETYKNGSSWYRIWSDGWCEQGGQIASVRTTTVNFLKPFVNNKYTAHVTNIGGTTGGGVPGCSLYSFTANSMTISVFDSTGTGTGAVDWSAYGYIN